MASLRDRRVLVTGAAGFIGANLVRTLLRQGAQIHALVSPRTDLWRLKEILPYISVHDLDLMRPRALRRCLGDIGPEYIFHLAVERRESTTQERQRTLRVNVLGLFNLLEAARAIDYLGFVHAGSSLEYGTSSRAHKETDLLVPSLFYGVTKAASTLLLQQFARKDLRPIVILRLFSVYGYWEAAHRLIPTAIMASINGSDLGLTKPGFRRDLVFIEDVVEACLRAAHKPGASGRIFNIGSGRQWTNEQVVQMVEAITRRPIRVHVGAYPPRPSDTARWVADIRRAREQLGWTPRHSLESGLRKTIRWFRMHQGLYSARSGTEAE